MNLPCIRRIEFLPYKLISSSLHRQVVAGSMHAALNSFEQNEQFLNIIDISHSCSEGNM